ncbi:MAG: hypothetical protein E3J29_01960 [Dehalococcoidia bacterium]|nr:MAG: hypothetical protein E3J29_01960 [Dehalococcoidia bacterium]
MHDQDRADKLAKAIEEMVQGRMPEDLDDEELQELLQIAKIRLDVARLAAEAGSEAQSAVLERLIARLNLLQKRDAGELNGFTAAHDRAGDIAANDEDPEHVDVKELQDVIDLRRQMAEHAAAVSEAHREAVWQRVQARIQASESEKRGFFRWPFRRRDREANDFGAALDRMILGEPIWEAKDSRLEELLRVARIRRVAATTARTGFVDQQARVWARLRPRLMARLGRSRHPRVFQRRAAAPWPKLAAAGAAVALVAAALGPIPATGLAHHPVTDFARFLGGHIGVSETSAPPTVPPVTEVIQSNDVSANQASALLDLPVYEPTFVPSGYHQVSSQYFPRALTASQGGLFVLAYENSGLTGSPETILIYQERASSNSIVVEQGFARDIWLSAGTPATYVNGAWRPLGSDLTWGEDDAQTILFDLGGLRTIIHTTDGDLPLADLVAIADSLAGQVAPPTN